MATYNGEDRRWIFRRRTYQGCNKAGITWCAVTMKFRLFTRENLWAVVFCLIPGGAGYLTPVAHPTGLSGLFNDPDHIILVFVGVAGNSRCRDPQARTPALAAGKSAALAVYALQPGHCRCAGWISGFPPLPGTNRIGMDIDYAARTTSLAR